MLLIPQQMREYLFFFLTKDINKKTQNPFNYLFRPNIIKNHILIWIE